MESIKRQMSEEVQYEETTRELEKKIMQEDDTTAAACKLSASKDTMKQLQPQTKGEMTQQTKNVPKNVMKQPQPMTRRGMKQQQQQQRRGRARKTF